LVLAFGNDLERTILQGARKLGCFNLLRLKSAKALKRKQRNDGN
jgi:hypothetical protein